MSKRTKNKIIKNVATGVLMVCMMGFWGTTFYEDIVNIQKKEQQSFKTDENGVRILNMNACNLSGDRLPNTKVDIGYGDREYWGYTNEYGQLVRVTAEEIILQKDEETNEEGRYCDDEAKVKGVEHQEYDEGHIIADSLGGVSNAYNIAPQNSTLNRYGDQAYMEKGIRQAGGCKNFEAILTYPDTQTQIPNHYRYSYTIQGNDVVLEFDNVNPEK